MSESSESLLSAAKSGDSAALMDLLLWCGPRLEAELSGRIGRRWRGALGAEDVLQVTYQEVCLGIRQFQGEKPEAFEAWVRRIAENNLRDAISRLKAGKRPDPRRRVGLVPGSDESVVSLLDVLAMTSSTPSRRASGEEARSLLAGAMARLPEDYATVVRMCDLEERPAAEAAAALGRSVGAVYMLHERARDRLRQLLPSASRVL